MAYHCVGYGFKCTFSDNGAGKTRVTYHAEKGRNYVAHFARAG